MADEPAIEETIEEEENTEESPPKKKPVLLLAIIGVAVLLLGGGAFATIHFGVFSKGDQKQLNLKDVENSEMRILDEEPGSLMALDSFIVNLAEKGSNRYLKTTIQLELGSATLVPHVTKRIPQIRDMLLTLFSNKTINDIKDVKGKLKLRKEIVQRLNEILGEGAVSQVYFTEFIIQ